MSGTASVTTNYTQSPQTPQSSPEVQNTSASTEGAQLAQAQAQQDANAQAQRAAEGAAKATALQHAAAANAVFNSAIPPSVDVSS